MDMAVPTQKPYRPQQTPSDAISQASVKTESKKIMSHTLYLMT